MITLPKMVCLTDCGGNVPKYLELLYSIFTNDFISTSNRFNSHPVYLKRNSPPYNGWHYTFYHITHSGPDETHRTPDMRRCERVPWAKPVVNSGESWGLKIWEQTRGHKDRVCIWLEQKDAPDYFVILEERQNFYLLWTTFIAQYGHEKRKKLREYQEYLKSKGR